MKGLTAKVFRTFNASITFQRLLDAEDLENATLQEKLNAYNKANREVAILCNHQRTAPKTHDQSMEKMRYKVRLDVRNIDSWCLNELEIVPVV
jgi:DNA topoisomerase-1